MTCVLCLFVNPPACSRCLRCRRAVAQSAAVEDESRVSFDPVFELMVDSGSFQYQPTELLNTLDFATDPTPSGLHFPPDRDVPCG